jgi:PAS domain S-box-containing protein
MNQIGFTQKQGIHHFIDKLPAVIFEYTIFPDGSRDFTYISPRCEEILGATQEEFLSGVYPLKDSIHKDDWDSFSESSTESLQKEWKWEGRVRTRRGYIWIEAISALAKVEDGLQLWNGIITDISARKKLERAQRESEQRYRDLVEHLPLGIGIHKEGKLVFANAYAAQLMGAKNAEDLIGQNILNFVHPDYRKQVLERAQQVLESGEHQPAIEEKYIRLDGRVIDVEALAFPFLFEGKKAVQVIAHDITEKKKAEATIRKTETLFSQLFQSTPMAVTMLDEKGDVVQINKGFEELFGYSLSELKGRSLNEFIVPDELETEGNDLNSIISNNKIIRIESARRRKDATMVSVIIYGVPVYLEDKTIGIFGVYVDITEQKKVEEELKVRNTELDNFVYKVSHDLRAPLSSILGLVHLASMPGNTDNPAEYLSLIGKKAEQLDHFIGDVLSHSKNLKMEMKIGKVDFQKIIDQTFTNLNYQKGAELVKREIVIRAEEFYSDHWRISEILRNLISNAIKYRQLQHQAPAIHIAIRADHNFAEILFTDNGIGIDANNLAHIFDMFYRASDQSEGSGLGLYIVKNAVDKLGGEISVDSKYGYGTSFKIKLPNQIPSE